MSLREQQSLFARDVVKLAQWASTMGYEYVFAEFQRPIEMQQIYVQTGRSKTMDSYHIKKLAADIFFFKDSKLLSTKEELDPLGSYWEALSPLNSWGGNWKSFKDRPHFERRYNG